MQISPTSSAPVSFAPSAQAPGSQNLTKTAYASREVESLHYQSMQLDLSLTDNRGRSVSLSLNTQQLQYSRTYDQFGSISNGMGKSYDTSSIMDEARKFIGGMIAEQGKPLSGAQSGTTIASKHESQSLDYKSVDMKVDGDVSLLQDYFASDKTAQRIFDFVSNLNPGFAAGSEEFANFANEIQKGVNSGFKQAQSMLGLEDLPQVSQDTKSLLDIMLAQYQKDPNNVASASSLLSTLHQDQAEA